MPDLGVRPGGSSERLLGALHREVAGGAGRTTHSPGPAVRLAPASASSAHPAPSPQRDRVLNLLVAGDKAGRWNQWYRKAIPLAEQRYERYLKQRAQEEQQQ